jgi:hypothetical protein
MKTKISSILIVLLSVVFAVSPKVQAVVPPPDGGYPNFTTAEGQKALFSLTTGAANTAVGWSALLTNAAGNFNTATGAGALLFNTADDNTAFGAATLLFNTAGMDNTAVGAAALSNNTMGQNNTATGAFALLLNTTGNFNTANGHRALPSNISGDRNTAIGEAAMQGNTSGSENTAVGYGALLFNPGGIGNTAVGYATLQTSAGDLNTALGDGAGFGVDTASGVTCIGAGVSGADVDNTTWIGNVYNVTTQSATTLPVVVSDGGQVGTTPSSRRFKKDIKPMDHASEAILALKPVTFHYKSDKTNTAQFGLVAEEVAEVNPDMVVRDKGGEIYTVRYDAVNAMLLNEFLKEHRKVQEQGATITQLQSTVTKQEAAIANHRKDLEATITGLKKEIETVVARAKEQDAKIQKVSDQVELSKHTPQTALNSQ